MTTRIIQQLFFVLSLISFNALSATVNCSTSYTSAGTSGTDEVVVSNSQTCSGMNINNVPVTSITIDQGGSVPTSFPASWNSGIHLDQGVTRIGTLTNNGNIGSGFTGGAYTPTTNINGLPWLGYYGITANRNIGLLINNSSGVISGYDHAIFMWSPYGNCSSCIYPDTGSASNSITTLNNYGEIRSNGSAVFLYIDTYGYKYIETLTNKGSIYSTGTGTYGIEVYRPLDLIGNLNNEQGAGNIHGALTYKGHLPTNYNIIINSLTQYGQLAVTGGSGSMAFGIYPGSTAAAGRYISVLTGLTSSNLASTSGSYSGFNWTLLNTVDTTTWDLVFSLSGPTAADTQASLATQARRLRSTFNSTMASSNFANMNTYDCNLFDKNNMCISAGGRYTNIDNPSSNNSAAVVVLGYKVNSNIRIGGFLDQSINHNTPTGINVSNKNPMMGAFAVWNQNADGLGYQVKIANAYLDKDVTTTRDVIGSSEAGTGKTNLNTQSYVGELSYAFNYQDSTIVRPYFALRYTNIKQDAYTETGVSTPLTYAKLGDRSTTALMGVKLNHALTPRTNLTASLGIEQDINHKTDQLVASGVADLTSENFNNNIKRTRPVASLGAYYAVAKNQRLSGEVYYQQLPFQSTGSATAYVNYMIGF
jgi:hypothetical protein